MPETVLGQCDSGRGAGLLFEIGLMIFVTQYQDIKHFQNLSNVRNTWKMPFPFHISLLEFHWKWNHFIQWAIVL